MKIRMLTGISGPEYDLAPKAETDRFSDDEAVRLMLSDQAEPADDAATDALAAARAARDAGDEPVEPEATPTPTPASAPTSRTAKPRAPKA